MADATFAVIDPDMVEIKGAALSQGEVEHLVSAIGDLPFAHKLMMLIGSQPMQKLAAFPRHVAS